MKLALVVLLCAATAALAKPLPSFDIDTCTWKATHVVVVTEGERIDGKVTVLESWKGDLLPGETLVLPELAAFASPESRLIGKAWWEKDEEKPVAYVTGKRMILFLKQVSKQADGTRVWEGANPQGLRVSLAWVEDSGPYEIVQTMNPGDAAIIQDYASEQALKEVFLELDATRTALERALALSDRAARANALVPLANTRLTRTQDAVFDALGACGPAAMPALRVILRDATEYGVDTRAIQAMGRAGGDEAAAELLALLRAELAFWRRTTRELDGVPVIPQETLTQAMLDPESLVSIGPWTEERRRQHNRTVAALYALEALHPRNGLEVVRELKDVWRSLPQLQQRGVHDSLAAECDAILTHPAETRN